MRQVLKVISISLIIALLNIALSFVSSVNLIWAFAIALFVADVHVFCIAFVLISGFILDMMMHDVLGSTSLSVLLALVIYILVKSVGFGKSLIQNIVLIILTMFLTLVFAGMLDWIITDVAYVSLKEFFYWIPEWIVNSFVSVLIYLFLSNRMIGQANRNVVKFK